MAGAERRRREELREIVDFLRDPQKFISLGARIPKGVLLVGPPGTGKTLIAKAVAGEAGVHFLSISGSDFVELYVGVGASRVRDLFDQAKKGGPRHRIHRRDRRRGPPERGRPGRWPRRAGADAEPASGGDGRFCLQRGGVIVMAATNRQDILDPALLRPGRFDRQIYVGLPDIRGQEEILKVHARKKPLAEDASLSDLARATAGFTGADLENLLNEAALLAARSDKRFITMSDLHEAMMKVIAGPEKKSRVVTPQAKRLTAYHEAGTRRGHPRAGQPGSGASDHHHPPRPRRRHDHLPAPGGTGPTSPAGSWRERIAVCLGGRVAEQLVLGDVSTGASSDIQKASSIARSMVTKFGMSDKLGAIAYGNESDEGIHRPDHGPGPQLPRRRWPVSSTRRSRPSWTRHIPGAREILTRCRKELELTAQYLLTHETMSGETFARVFTDPDGEEFTALPSQK